MSHVRHSSWCACEVVFCCFRTDEPRVTYALSLASAHLMPLSDTRGPPGTSPRVPRDDCMPHMPDVQEQGISTCMFHRSYALVCIPHTSKVSLPIVYEGACCPCHRLLEPTDELRAWTARIPDDFCDASIGGYRRHCRKFSSLWQVLPGCHTLPSGAVQMVTQRS